VQKDLYSSSSSSDRIDSSGATAEEVEDEDAETGATEVVFYEETVLAEVASDDEATATDASFGEEGVVVEASIDENNISMDELEAAKLLLTLSLLHLLVTQDLLRELLMNIQLLGLLLVL
jgi:hypothetical protein